MDLARRVAVARHSYERPFSKSKKQRVVRIPEEFVAFYVYALRVYPGPPLFPHEEGLMRDRTWHPEDTSGLPRTSTGCSTSFRAWSVT